MWWKLHQGELDCKSEELGSVFRATQDAMERTQDLVPKKIWDLRVGYFWLPMGPQGLTHLPQHPLTHQ